MIPNSPPISPIKPLSPFFNVSLDGEKQFTSTLSKTNALIAPLIEDFLPDLNTFQTIVKAPSPLKAFTSFSPVSYEPKIDDEYDENPIPDDFDITSFLPENSSKFPFDSKMEEGTVCVTLESLGEAEKEGDLSSFLDLNGLQNESSFFLNLSQETSSSRPDHSPPSLKEWKLKLSNGSIALDIPQDDPDSEYWLKRGNLIYCWRQEEPFGEWAKSHASLAKKSSPHRDNSPKKRYYFGKVHETKDDEGMVKNCLQSRLNGYRKEVNQYPPAKRYIARTLVQATKSKEKLDSLTFRVVEALPTTASDSAVVQRENFYISTWKTTNPLYGKNHNFSHHPNPNAPAKPPAIRSDYDLRDTSKTKRKLDFV